MADFNYSIFFRAINNSSRMFNKVKKDLKDVETTVKKVKNSTRGMTSSMSANLSKASKSVNRFNQGLKQQSDNLGNTAAGFIALAYSISRPIKQAIEFESAMADVKKVLNGTDQEFVQIRKDILLMSKTIPLLPTQISQIVASGARLGIPAEQLKSFTMNVAKASVAFDMSAEAAGNAFASIANKMGLPLSKIEMLGDAINHLSDTTATTAPAVIEIMGRLSGTLKQLEIPPELGAGISAFADQVFVSQELAASGVQQFVSALARTNEKFGLFTKLQKEGEKGFRQILGTLSKLDMTELTKAFGSEAARSIATMSGSLEVYDKTLVQVADNTKFAGSMTREFASRSATTANKITLMMNKVNRLFIKIGDVALPIINDILDALSPVIESTIKWVEANQETVNTVIKIALGLSLLIGAAVALKLAIIPITLAISTFSAVLTGASVAFKVLNLVMKANPLFLILGVVTSLILYLGVFEDKIKAIKDAFMSLMDKFALGGLFEKLGSILGFANNELEIKKTIQNNVAPLESINRNRSDVNITLQAKDLEVVDTQTKTTGDGLSMNLGQNSLGT